jgi:hypothetical protein
MNPAVVAWKMLGAAARPSGSELPRHKKIERLFENAKHFLSSSLSGFRLLVRLN